LRQPKGVKLRILKIANYSSSWISTREELVGQVRKGGGKITDLSEEYLSLLSQKINLKD